MHTVAETKSFQKQASDAGMLKDEVEALVAYLANNPMAGDEIPGTGGCRKLRFAGKGKGKRGGYRTITFYSGGFMPVFLLAIFSKGEKVDLTNKERSQLATISKLLVDEYQTRVTKVRA